MTTTFSAHGIVTAAGVIGTSIQIEDGRISSVTGAREHGGSGNASLLDGFLVPGLTDSHVHLSGWAARVSGLHLGSAVTFAGIADQIRNHAGTLGEEAPVIGNGLDDNVLGERRLPTRHDLDRILSDRPILLHRHCGHIAVANTAALTLSGITPDTPDPLDGVLDRDTDGIPTGVLREAAIGLVGSALEPLVRAPLPEQLISAAYRLAALGITGVSQMTSTGTPMWCGSGNELDDLLAVAPDLPIDVEVFVITGNVNELRTAAERIHRVGGRLRFGGWKGFADGSLGGHTAAMAAPYADHTGAGMILLHPERDSELIEAALAAGGGATIHAIGDHANRIALDLIDQVVARGADPAKLRIEHASILDPDLIRRLAGSGITVSVQPAFVLSDSRWLAERIGGRARWAYPFRSLEAAGVPLRAGSDAPVEDPNPWAGIAAATNHAITPEESVSIGTALGMFGATTPLIGMPADLVLVDRNPHETSDIAATKVLAVWKDGLKIF